MLTSEIKETLRELGFKLNDKGHFWSTNAIWRNGDNYSAVQIYKDSGVWRDYVDGTQPSPFKVLVAKALGIQCDKELDKYDINNLPSERDIFDFKENKPEIKMDKTYNIEDLKDLLPHYKFYEDKKISKQTLKMYRSGFCTKGKMNNRYVFPILDYEFEEKLIGFSGRSLLWKDGDDSFPKWKHLGTKKGWIFPLCFKGVFEQEVESSKEVILVESIGDSLALTENKIYNHMVTFGIDLSQSQKMALLSLSPDKIIIAMNNDSSSSKNAGLISAIKHFVSLMDFFDMEKIQIKLPQQNDLSDMHKNSTIGSWIGKKVDLEKQRRYIFNFLKDPRNTSVFRKKEGIKSKIAKFSSHFNEDIL